jgi:hypothetical protein
MSRRVLHPVQLWRIGTGHGHNVEPELVIKMASLFPFVRRQADGPGLGAGLDLNIADVGKGAILIVQRGSQVGCTNDLLVS